jgi:hypothetical protein
VTAVDVNEFSVLGLVLLHVKESISLQVYELMIQLLVHNQHVTDNSFSAF